jgi:hypothetical protein
VLAFEDKNGHADLASGEHLGTHLHDHRGSSDLSMVRSSPVWPLSVGCEPDAESVVLEVFEPVG